MKPLERSQALLERALRQPEALLGDGRFGELDPLIADGPRLGAREQAEIYREQYWLRHRDCLLEDYPALRQLLGEQGFDAFVRAYLEAHPPTSFTLRDLGARVADFAAGWDGFDPAVAAPARDAARYELAFVELFDGPDAEPLGLDALAAIPEERWPSTRLVFHPLLTLLRLSYPVDALRRALRKGSEAPELTSGALWLALWRGPDLGIREERLTESQHALLVALRRGAPLGEALGAIAEPLPATERAALGAELQGWFQRWARRGWIVRAD